MLIPQCLAHGSSRNAIPATQIAGAPMGPGHLPEDSRLGVTLMQRSDWDLEKILMRSDWDLEILFIEHLGYYWSR